MLAFSRRQLAALADTSYLSFLRETLVLHRRDCPGLVDGKSDDEAIKLLDDSVQIARDFGFTTEALIRRFLVVQAVAGPAFHQNPDFAATHQHLEADITNAHTRMMRIEDAVVEVLNSELEEDDPFG